MYIETPARTLKDWADRLTITQMAALAEMREDAGPEDELTPGEVLEALVEWNGGLATAHQIKQMVGRIYGVEL